MIDYSQDSPSVNNLSTKTVEEVGALAQRQVALEKEVLALEAQLEEKEKALNHVQGVQLPELLQTMGIASVKLSDGSQLEIKDLYAAHISKEHKISAHNWLSANGFDSLIKRSFIIPIDPDPQKANDLAGYLALQGIEFAVEGKVHSAALKSFVKGQLESTEENAVKPPFDLFGIFIAKKAVIKNTENKQPKRKYKKA